LFKGNTAEFQDQEDEQLSPAYSMR